MSQPSTLRQIVALGGAGWGSKDRLPEDTLLDDYLLKLGGKQQPKVCFVPTASGDSEIYIQRFYADIKGAAKASHLPLFQRSHRDPAAHLLAQDIIYVGGGNTANMLAIWRVHGVDRALRAAWRRGIILCGVSAGMICWFDCGVTDSFGPLAALRDGLGLLPGSACPHYDGEKLRRPTYHRLAARRLPAGVAADDSVAIHFVGRKILRCVSARPHARAYRVEKIRGRVVEEPLPTEFLGGHT